ncbi:Phosphotyrosyl phosphate activator protein-domain-containing protein [Plectosphaerella cucumerina]|uniref:Serine/threonine-protein phosphatase 2A activator n=1 Tax=Plectosphaerella cucumerina TaxID=40658 RepID=A0A8K0WXK9_9PEZI|nr:Phosphotyrosyl phosphate activator protein-domain-containing protein [Plectosphaerella cucumerina]
MEAPSSSPSPLSALEVLDPAAPPKFQKLEKRINDGPDVTTFLTSKAYRDIGTFVLQLNRALCPRKHEATADGKESIRTFPLTSLKPSAELPSSIQGLQTLLKKAEALIDSAPPDPGPRRFGNVAFRTWHGLLADQVRGLLEEFVPTSVLEFGGPGSREGILDELVGYFVGAFGSAQRLDYGTGHELSFLAFLGGLWKLRFFEEIRASTTGAEDGETERMIVLGVIEPYLKVVRRLILTYTLEPAGSHGVWGLDDHAFLPYIFGSAQFTRAITATEAMPTEGSVRGAPKTGDIVKATVVEDYRTVNMYFSAIGFINDVKKGPFWEHSPILFDVSGIRDGWGKINKGMIKMFNAEVLSKFPVVQHFHFGALFSWDQDPNAAAPAHSIHIANQPNIQNFPAQGTAMPPPGGAGMAGTAAPWAAGAATRAPGAGSAGTAAPWANAARAPGAGAGVAGIPYSRVPPARAGGAMPPPSVTGRVPPSTTTSGPGPRTGTLAQAGNTKLKEDESTDGQITMTKAPWAS